FDKGAYKAKWTKEMLKEAEDSQRPGKAKGGVFSSLSGIVEIGGMIIAGGILYKLFEKPIKQAAGWIWDKIGPAVEDAIRSGLEGLQSAILPALRDIFFPKVPENRTVVLPDDKTAVLPSGRKDHQIGESLPVGTTILPAPHKKGLMTLGAPERVVEMPDYIGGAKTLLPYISPAAMLMKIFKSLTQSKEAKSAPIVPPSVTPEEKKEAGKFAEEWLKDFTSPTPELPDEQKINIDDIIDEFISPHKDISPHMEEMNSGVKKLKDVLERIDKNTSSMSRNEVLRNTVSAPIGVSGVVDDLNSGSLPRQ
ncbi:MAG: hypothetical protein ACTSWQ_05935, partial [Candidatus Thorarchaeota archaeon]